MRLYPFKWLFRYAQARRRGRRWRQRPLEERIALEAERMQRELGISAIAALAAAEAVELGHDHGLLFDRIEFDDSQLRWQAIYEPREDLWGMEIVLPLGHATEATQRGIGSMN